MPDKLAWAWVAFGTFHVAGISPVDITQGDERGQGQYSDEAFHTEVTHEEEITVSILDTRHRTRYDTPF
jgi:hypothetical protein